MFEKLQNIPIVIYSKLLFCSDVASRKFDRICLTSSNPNYSGLFLSCGMLFAHLCISSFPQAGSLQLGFDDDRQIPSNFLAATSQRGSNLLLDIGYFVISQT